ncbi:Capsular synthesis regulator component B [Serratia fonticola]|uniref:Capsular synthesis regulator component B n=2 Tax=Serratia fonticola TaxID=47917 RepID=A0A4U9US88_SERFO|nr:Capsular synthesis regulator component B [Serratia fonticola]
MVSRTTNYKLTRREAEVIRLYVSGMSVNDIASQLKRTKQTISSQKTSAMRKLQISRDADLFRFAFETGLTSVG